MSNIVSPNETHPSLINDTQKADDRLWYFAYGANMSVTKVLIERRRVRPTQVIPCRLSHFGTSFSLPGFPFFEPCFASIVALDESVFAEKEASARVMEYRKSWTCVASWKDGESGKLERGCYGLACWITRAEYRRIRQTEGGGGHEGVGYSDLWIKPQVIGAPSLSTDETLNVPLLYSKLDAVALFCDPTENVNIIKAPSLRYVRLLYHGAKQNGIPEEYCRALSTTPCFVGSGQLSFKLYRLGFIGLVLGLCMPWWIYVGVHLLVSMRRRLPLPRHTYLITHWLSDQLWWLYGSLGGQLGAQGKINPDLVTNETSKL